MECPHLGVFGIHCCCFLVFLQPKNNIVKFKDPLQAKVMCKCVTVYQFILPIYIYITS